MNRSLKATIVYRFGTQDDFAMAIGKNSSIVSKVIRGKMKLSSEEQLAWAEVLMCEPNEIFEGINLPSEEEMGMNKNLIKSDYLEPKIDQMPAELQQHNQ